MRAAPPIYHAVMLEVERRRQHLGWSMDRLSEIAGVADRAYPKYLYAETVAGRMAQWDTLQVILDALFPDGVEVIFQARSGAKLDALALKYRVHGAAALNDRRTMREHMREVGKRGGLTNVAHAHRVKIARKGGRARARRLSAEQRACIAREASIVRWSKKDDDA